MVKLGHLRICARAEVEERLDGAILDDLRAALLVVSKVREGGGGVPAMQPRHTCHVRWWEYWRKQQVH